MRVDKNGRFKFLKSPNTKMVLGISGALVVFALGFQNCAQINSQKWGSSSQNSLGKAPVKLLAAAKNTGPVTCAPIQTTRVQSQSVPGLVTLAVTSVCSGPGIATYYSVSSILVKNGKIYGAGRFPTNNPL